MHCSLSVYKFIHVILYLCLSNMLINTILRCKLWSLFLLTTILILMCSTLNKAYHRAFCNSNTIKEQYKINVWFWFKIWVIQVSKQASKLRVLEKIFQIVLSESRAFCSLQITEGPPRLWMRMEFSLQTPRLPTHLRATPLPSKHPTASFCGSFSFKIEFLRSTSSTLKKTVWSSYPSSKGFIWWQQMIRLDWRPLNIIFKWS